MSIIIQGMEMPAECSSCPMCDDLNRDIMPACNVTGERMAMGNHYYERLDSCPLIELPPHGDLIDRNKLYEKTADWEAQALHMVEVTMHDEDTTEWRKWSTVLRERSAFKFDVADAPVIIPTERGEE